MELGSVKSTATTYQGSGLDQGASQKVMVDVKAAAAPAPAKSDKVIKKDKIIQADSTERGSESKDSKADLETKLEIQEPSRKDSIMRAVEQINRRSKNSEAIFGIHDKTNRVTIKIVDKETKEVLKEFPPEETLDMIAKVWELAGLMLDEKG